MRKILGISGSMKKDDFSSTEFLLDVALEQARLDGAETKHIRLIDYNILPCTGCGQCMNNQHCHLLSNPKDQLMDLYNECCEADGFIFSSPVYALSLPAIWKNWMDRCEPCDDSDLEYEYYCYDVVKQVKGKAFRGKVAGQMYVSAGSGQEWAISSLVPAFTAVQLSMVVSVGLSLIEFDAQPGIKKQNWSRPIQEADFAINIAKSVGQRVFQTVGYSTFKIDSANRAKVLSEITLKMQEIENGQGVIIKVQELSPDKVVFIASTKEHADSASLWYEELIKAAPNQKSKIYNLTEVEQLPHFIKQSFVKKNVLRGIDKSDYDQYLFDWDMKVFSTFFTYDFNYPTVIVFDNRTEKVTYKKACLPSQHEIEAVVQVLTKEE